MYRVVTDDPVLEQMDALPAEGLRGDGEVLLVLENTPELGRPYNDDHPDGPMRELAFGLQGQGSVTYLVLRRRREVHVLVVLWVG